MKKIEIWKEINNYPGYFISSYGNVLSPGRYNKIILRHPAVFKSGYRFASLRNKNGKKQIKVSRLVAIHFINNKENKKEVNHKDGNKVNDCVSNLEWTTRSENQKHAFKNGLQKPKVGEKSNFSKLKECDVLKILKLLNEKKLYQREIAKLFNVARTTISSIKNGYNWKYL